MNRHHRIVLFLLLMVSVSPAQAQTVVGMGTKEPNPNAVLELVPQNGNQGFLAPRLNSSQRTAPAFVNKLTASDNGLLVFDTDLGSFFYWHNQQWHAMSTRVALTTDVPSLPEKHVFMGNSTSQATPVIFSQDIIVAVDGTVTTTGLRGKKMSQTAPEEKQVLQYREGEWTPTTLETDVNRWYAGTSDPTANDPAKAQDGNLFINTATQEIFIREGGAWKSSGKLVDPESSPEVFHAPLDNTMQPDPGTGKIGDLFVETDPDYDVYIKVGPTRWKKIDDKD